MRSYPIKYLLKYLCGFLPLVLLAACTQNKERVIERAAYSTIDNLPSEVNLPMVYKVGNLEKIINKKIKKTLHFDDSFEDNGNDRLKLKVWRNGKIRLKAAGNMLSYSVPLRVEVEKKLISTKKIFGKELFKGGHKTTFSLKLLLSSHLEIDTDWKLMVKTAYDGLVWKKRPKVTVFKIDVSDLVEQVLQKKIGGILGKVDESLRKNLKVRNVVNKIWTDLQKPILINKLGERLWLQFSPFKIAASTMETKGNNLFLRLQIGAYAQTLLGKSPDYAVNHQLPNLEKKQHTSDSFDLNIACKLPFDLVNTMLDSFVVGREIPIKGQKIRIEGATMSGGSTDLYFDVTISGDVNGHVTFKGKPVFDSLQKALRVEGFDFEVKSADWVVSIADEILHDKIKTEIESKMVLPLEGYIRQIPQLISRGIAKGKLRKKLQLEVKNLQMDLKKTHITHRDLQFVIGGKGNTVLKLKEF